MDYKRADDVRTGFSQRFVNTKMPDLSIMSRQRCRVARVRGVCYVQGVALDVYLYSADPLHVTDVTKGDDGYRSDSLDISLARPDRMEFETFLFSQTLVGNACKCVVCFTCVDTRVTYTLGYAHLIGVRRNVGPGTSAWNLLEHNLPEDCLSY